MCSNGVDQEMEQSGGNDPFPSKFAASKCIATTGYAVQMALKCADLGHIAEGMAVHLKWGGECCEACSK